MVNEMPASVSVSSARAMGSMVVVVFMGTTYLRGVTDFGAIRPAGFVTSGGSVRRPRPLLSLPGIARFVLGPWRRAEP
jgi:hypothetical protein